MAPTARPANHGYLRSLGAIPVTYGDRLEVRVRAIAPKGVTAVLDCIGGPALEQSASLATDPARIVTIADRVNAPRLGIQVIGTDRAQRRLIQLLELYQAGKLAVQIHRVFALSDAALAHREVQTGHVRGKVVLVR